MMHPKSTNTNHYAKAPVAMVAMAASLLVVQAKPADASTTFTVKSDAADSNPGDGQCSVLGSFCSLRAAIQESNATPGADAINFNILGTAGDGIATISPSSALPDQRMDGLRIIGGGTQATGRGSGARPMAPSPPQAA